MRRRTVIPLLLLLAVQATGQTTPDCGPVIVQKLDSVVGYVREGLTDFYTPVDLFIYQYDEAGHYPVVDRISLPSRTPVNRQNYFFDETGRKAWYILQDWNGVGYSDHARTDYYYNDAGYLEKEIYKGFEDTLWVPYQYHVYNYDENNIIRTYLRKMMYASGEWTDFSYKNYIYDASGKLIERNEQRIADGVIFWVELFTYNDQGKTATRVRQTLKYFPETGTYGLVNLNRQIYSYDSYNELSGYLTETWTDNGWVLTGKSVYYRSLDKDKIVPVCYKGETRMVYVRIAVRLIYMGALPGSCECLFPEGYPGGSKGNDDSSGDAVLMVYPNPASYEMTIILPEGQTVRSDISIYSHTGSLVQRTIAGSQSETVDISALKPGSYYLVVTGEGKSLMTSFVKKD